MALDVWFREDVVRILAATQETMAATMDAAPALDPEQAGAYRQGFTDALRVVAVAFGVVSPTLPASRPASHGHVAQGDGVMVISRTSHRGKTW